MPGVAGKEAAGEASAGVDDDDVDASGETEVAAVIDGAGDELVDVIFAGGVAGDGVGLAAAAADGLDELVEFFGAACADDDGGALPGEILGDGPADAGGSPVTIATFPVNAM